jgi:hypothetical protein
MDRARFGEKLAHDDFLAPLERENACIFSERNRLQKLPFSQASATCGSSSRTASSLTQLLESLGANGQNGQLHPESIIFRS